MKMGRSHLNVLNISFRNIKQRPFRSLSLIGLIFLLSFVLTGGSLLASSLINGTDSMAARLGADALIVPSGYEHDAENALLRGEPSSFYFDTSLVERLVAVEGVEKASPQLFIASLDSEHCSVPVQIIGYDPETDFVIAPWLAEQLPGGLPDGQLLVGYSVQAKAGDKIGFFSRIYTVAGRLEQTGMGFDSSVFVNMETARQVLTDYAALEDIENFNPNVNDPVSSLTVAISRDHDPADFARSVRMNFRSEGVGVVLPQTMISSVSNNLQSFLLLLTILLVFLWVLVVAVLAIMFLVTLNERKREFGIFRALGATRGKLGAMILTEAAVISLVGALLGTAFLSLVYFSFSPLIGLTTEMPYLQLSPGTTGLLIGGGFLLAFLTGPAASALSALRIGRLTTHAIMKEGA